MQFILLLSLLPPPLTIIFNRIKLFQKISKISMPSYIKIYPAPPEQIYYYENKIKSIITYIITK